MAGVSEVGDESWAHSALKQIGTFVPIKNGEVRPDTMYPGTYVIEFDTTGGSLIPPGVIAVAQDRHFLIHVLGDSEDERGFRLRLDPKQEP